MTRIAQTFAALKRNSKKALVAYITAGHPDLETTAALIPALDSAGVDILEIGVPFSDPTADGPIIQEASQAALRGGATLKGVLALIREVRRKTQMPIVLFSYYNPIFSYGNGDFARDARNAGVDGLLVVDLPFEESQELRSVTDKAGLDFISLIAPTTDAKRAAKSLRRASGFVYYISMTGVTGSGKPVVEDIVAHVSQLRALTRLPIVAGFGITDPQQARDVARGADGVVVGSALVKILHSPENREERIDRAVRFARDLKNALL